MALEDLRYFRHIHAVFVPWLMKVGWSLLVLTSDFVQEVISTALGVWDLNQYLVVLSPLHKAISHEKGGVQ